MFFSTMGQNLSCLRCGVGNTKIIPLRTTPSLTKFSQSRLPFKDASFHRPGLIHLAAGSSVENLSTDLSKRTSLATISLGSVQTLSFVNKNNDTEITGGRGGSCSHPGLQTTEPEDLRLDTCPSTHSSRISAQKCSSSLRHLMSGRQSRVGITASFPRPPTPRPYESTLILVKPYQGSSEHIPEEPEPEQVCKHGKPLTGAHGDPHEVNCVRCERPASRGGRALTGMIAFRRAEARRRKEEKRLKKEKLVEEQEKRKRTSEAYENALRQFAERQRKETNET